MLKWIARATKYVLDSPVVKNVVVTWVVQSIGLVTGPIGYAVKWLVDKAYELVRKYTRREVVRVETTEEVKEQLKEYEKVINDPNSTADDIRRAGTDFITD